MPHGEKSFDGTNDLCYGKIMKSTIVNLTISAALGTAGIVSTMTGTSHAQEPNQEAAKSHLAAPLIPMRDFFRNPETTGYDLSPSGTQLAFLKPWKNRMNVHVQTMGSDEVTRVTSAENRDIAGFAWVSDDRIVFVQDTGGDENFRLYAVDADGGNSKDLTPFEEVRVGVIDDLEDDPKHMLISMNKRDKRFFDAFQNQCRQRRDGSCWWRIRGNYSGYITDHDGKLRIITTTDGVNAGLLYRAERKV